LPGEPSLYPFSLRFFFKFFSAPFKEHYITACRRFFIWLKRFILRINGKEPKKLTGEERLEKLAEILCFERRSTPCLWWFFKTEGIKEEELT
jgi:hypothetical protein